MAERYYDRLGLADGLELHKSSDRTLSVRRKSHASHTRTLRDGWRTERFLLICSPRKLFLVPGVALIVLGVIAHALAMPGVEKWGVTFDGNTLMFSALAGC
jgi:hypothetical protein